jgi:hypothetical protein
MLGDRQSMEKKPKLVLKFRLAQDEELQVRGASHIRIDGCGELVFRDAASGVLERINLSRMELLDIHAINAPGRNECVTHAA